MHGPTKAGKTTLAAQIAKVGIEPIFFDLEKGTQNLDVTRVDGVEVWRDILDALADDMIWPEECVIVVDTGTRAERWAVADTLENVRGPNDSTVKSVEGYGYGKGYIHVMETFLHLLAALDRHAAKGRHVVIICHSCVARVPNPVSDDWLRFEPDLQSVNKGDIRGQVTTWADHILHLDLDVHVSKEGKGQGSGSRTIHVAQTPIRMAGSRTLQNAIVCNRDDAEVWRQLLKGGK